MIKDIDKFPVGLIQWLYVDKKKQSNIRDNFLSKTRIKLALFSVIAMKSVEVVFEKKINKIKEMNWKYAIT